MEEAARWHEQNSELSQNFCLGPDSTGDSTTDQDLTSRVRSLLLSRNGRYPPKTPASSPDFNSTSSPVAGPSSYLSDSESRLSEVTIDRNTAKLLQQTSDSKMAINHYEGPAGQIEDVEMEGLRRHPSQPEIPSDRRVGKRRITVRVNAGLDHKTLSGSIGRERLQPTSPLMNGKVGMPDQTESSERKLLSGGPGYVLRTIVPASLRTVDERLRPNAQHVPGSYRSEFPATPAVDPSTKHEILMPTPEALSISHSKITPSSPTMPNEVVHLEPVLSNRTSNSTMRLKSSTPHIRYPLFVASNNHSTIGLPVEPVLTQGLRHEHSHSEKDIVPKPEIHTNSGSITRTPSSKFEIKARSSSLGPNTSSSPYNKQSRALSSSRIAELLTDLPPFSQRNATTNGSSVAMGLATNSITLPASRSGYSPSLYSNRSSLSRHNAHSSEQLPDALEGYEGLVQDYQEFTPLLEPSNTGPLSEENNRSVSSRRLSILSRALTNLSDLSAKSFANTPKSGSSRRYDMYDFMNEAARLQKSPSGSSTDDSASTNETTDLRRLARQPPIPQIRPYRTKAPTVTSFLSEGPERKQHWVKQLLGRKSATASIISDHPNLTTRPVHRQKRALQDAISRHRAHTAPMHNVLNTGVDGSEPQRLNTNSSEAASIIRVQRANNESFSKIIVDLELLLQDAIHIARDAADKEERGKSRPTDCQSSSKMSDDTQGQRDSRGPSRYRNQPLQFLLNSSEQLPRSSAGSHDGHEGSDYSVQMRKGKCIMTVESHRDEIQDQLGMPRELSPEKTNAQSRKASFVLKAATETPSTNVLELREFNSLPGPVLATHVLDLCNSAEAIGTQPRKSLNLPNPALQLDHVIEELVTHSETNGSDMPHRSRRYPEPYESLLPVQPESTQLPLKEQHNHVLRGNQASPDIPSQADVHEYISTYSTPPILPRNSSARLRTRPIQDGLYEADLEIKSSSEEDNTYNNYIADFYHSGIRSRTATRQGAGEGQFTSPGLGPGPVPRQDTLTSIRGPTSQHKASVKPQDDSKDYSLEGRHHYSIKGVQGFSLSRSHRRAPIARDWSTSRKRYVAAVACISTALMGLLIGIYAGEVPAIQYAIVDEDHLAILGNVFFFIGVSIPTALFWPLPLLHGRKPYTLSALVLLLPLQFPQAIAVGQATSPNIGAYRVGLLLSRGLAGLAMGFANMNFKSTLTDLFGASLQSGNPHQEIINQNDVRRHGGGMGVWLGIWTWCSIGSIGVGFLIGAGIISNLSTTWGFYIAMILIAAVLLLNVMTPEVRRSAYRRSMAEVGTGSEISRRIAKGEVMMHLYSTGPRYWWEEVWAGHVLCVRMLKQPGFAIMSLYLGWIYGQVVMVIVLLGALTSKYYFFLPQYVGLCVSAIPVGALLSIPFQKASLFSRARHHAPRTDSMTFEKRVTWTSHLVRRAIFMITLPFAGLAYTLSSGGAHIPFILPTLFAGLIGFLSNLAISECNGLIMETFDTSDLQPGMTGRPRRVLPDNIRKKRTNFSSFPRITAGFAVAETFAFLIAAAATGAGGAVERALGAQEATAVVAGVLLVLTILLILSLTRFKTVQIVPTQRYGSAILGGPEDDWKPVIIGNPSGTTRRISLLELGGLSRWSEIRRRNRVMSGLSPEGK